MNEYEKTVKLTESEISNFHKIIFENYSLFGRKFPWRETLDPYAILVSEMMLQQTQTMRVLPKYISWMKKFPSARILADASLSEALSLWNGLGYNRRAKYLQETCRVVCNHFRGQFPENVEDLESLPGIGPYTARAVATFSFGKLEVFIETNIRSVFIFFFYPGHTEKIPDKLLLPLVAQTVPKNNPRDWYYALMDYGAELKRNVKNPSRQSSHYVKQSRFEGSLRQARGAILRNLTEGREASLRHISNTEDIPLCRIQEAATELVAEKLVKVAGDIYRMGD